MLSKCALLLKVFKRLSYPGRKLPSFEASVRSTVKLCLKFLHRSGREDFGKSQSELESSCGARHLNQAR